jgi:hypothetical protein
LKSFSWDCEESALLLSSLIQVIEKSVALHYSDAEPSGQSDFIQPRPLRGFAMTAQGLGSCFLGIQNLPGDRPEMQWLLSFLASSIPLCTTPIDTQVMTLPPSTSYD